MSKAIDTSEEPEGPKPNLTYTRWVARMERLRDQEVNAIPEHQVVKTAVLKRDAKGKPVLENGFPALMHVDAFKRDVVKAEHDSRIANARKSFGL